QQQGHTRVYQACIPCRRRKVRCDLGPVDNPHDPPCLRCRRESKECFFSKTRRKSKHHDGADDDSVGTADRDQPSEYEIRNARKRVRTDEGTRSPTAVAAPAALAVAYGGPVSPRPLTPGGSVGQSRPLRRPGGPGSAQQPPNEEEDVKASDKAAALLQASEIYSGHDALHLLMEAAGRNGDIAQRRGTGSSASLQSPHANGARMFGAGGGPRQMAETPVDPAIAQSAAGGSLGPDDVTYNNAIKAWSRFRFVRNGWFSAKEAIDYVDYFYQHMAPLTPIVPDFRSYACHEKLLRDEPMLLMTLLTISSRYMSLSGSGANSRAGQIHGRLWSYLRKMIDRLIWGQEKVENLNGAIGKPGSDINPLTRRGLRTLGTVESLMLLTEWHPKALHFPPDDDDDDFLLPDMNDLMMQNDSALEDGNSWSRGAKVDSFLEPCWKSDQICWNLLGLAMTVAIEIGVLTEAQDNDLLREPQEMSQDDVVSFLKRKRRIKELLLIYISQTCGRCGFTSMVPNIYAGNVPQSPGQVYNERFRGLLGAGRQGLDAFVSFDGHNTDPLDTTIRMWTQIALLNELGNQLLFPSKKETRDMIKSGRHMKLLEDFQPKLKQWRKEFDSYSSILPHMRYLLTIEFEYGRMYINSVALQAVMERCTHSGADVSMANNMTTSDGAPIPFNTLAKMSGDCRPYIFEVIDASRQVLSVVVNRLAPGRHLRHVPVRTYFRIVSAILILLKTFVVGASEADVIISLDLLDKAIDALRNSAVDDVHVANLHAENFQKLTNRVRSTFVRMHTNSNAANPGTHVYGAPGSADLHSPMMPPPTSATSIPRSHGMLHQGMSKPSSPWLANSPSLPTHQTPPHASTTTTHPILHGITADTFDPSLHNIMPPPGLDLSPGGSTFYEPALAGGGGGQNVNSSGGDCGSSGAGGPGSAHGGAGGGSTNGNNMFSGFSSDWLALPLNPLYGYSGADVNNTVFGPELGGGDFLDVML
ncbi:hypothetical protein BDY21DRAFT_258620, partial [Lineolata rhizophorae]